MPFNLTPLPYAQSALEPYFSSETLAYHHGKHQQTYVNALNKLVVDTKFTNSRLEEIIRHAEGALFNNAAQVWNHEFYWHCLTTPHGQHPKGELERVLIQNFDTISRVKTLLIQAAMNIFGSGWVWLLQMPDKTLSIETTANAQSPLCSTAKPLLTIDVWEHAYYIDYRNQRTVYLEAVWQCLNWNFVEERLNKPSWGSPSLAEC